MNHVFPKLAVYNSVDPSLAPSLLMVSSFSDFDILHETIIATNFFSLKSSVVCLQVNLAASLCMAT